MPNSSSTSGRKRGGQPRNKNALKHGLYAKRITDGERLVLEGMKVTDIVGEIAYMRVVCGRIASILESNGLENEATKVLSEQAIRMLLALDKAMTTLLNYVRQYALQTGELHELEADIEQGKDLARIAHNVYNYLDPSDGS